MPRRKTTKRRRRLDPKEDLFTDRSYEENSEIIDLMDNLPAPPPVPMMGITTSTKKLAKISDETSSYGIPSGSNTPQVVDTCDPRISQGLEILQRYEKQD